MAIAAIAFEQPYGSLRAGIRKAFPCRGYGCRADRAKYPRSSRAVANVCDCVFGDGTVRPGRALEGETHLSSLTGRSHEQHRIGRFRRHAAEDQYWLKEIEAQLGPDRHRSYQALRAVLHCLRDRLSVDQAAHLAAQLPLLVRGIYYEAYRPTGKPEKVRSRDEFLEHVSRYFKNIRPIGADDAVGAVFAVLGRHCDPGEVRNVIEALPLEIRTLWPNHDRYTTKAAAQVD